MEQSQDLLLQNWLTYCDDDGNAEVFCQYKEECITVATIHEDIAPMAMREKLAEAIAELPAYRKSLYGLLTVLEIHRHELEEFLPERTARLLAETMDNGLRIVGAIK